MSDEMNNTGSGQATVEVLQPFAEMHQKPANPVENLIEKVKEDPALTDASKLETMSMLIMKFLRENEELESEIRLVLHQTTKHIEARNAIQALNEFLKKQISVLKEEGELLLQEEKKKTEESIRNEQDKQLSQESQDIEDEDPIERMKMEKEFEITCLEHEIAKAKIEAAEVRAEMAKDRLALTKELAEERERGMKLTEMVKYMKEQADIYEDEMMHFHEAGLNNTKTFQSFKSKIDKLTGRMVELESETNERKSQSQVSFEQLKEMNLASSEKEKELTSLKRKLESMLKLNKALQDEKEKLLERITSTT